MSVSRRSVRLSGFAFCQTMNSLRVVVASEKLLFNRSCCACQYVCLVVRLRLCSSAEERPKHKKTWSTGAVDTPKMPSLDRVGCNTHGIRYLPQYMVETCSPPCRGGRGGCGPNCFYGLVSICRSATISVSLSTSRSVACQCACLGVRPRLCSSVCVFFAIRMC